MQRFIEDLVERIMGGDKNAKRVAQLCKEAAGEMGNLDVCKRISAPEDIAILKSASSIVSSPGENRIAPFCLDGDLLYTRQNWMYENIIATKLKALAGIDEADNADIKKIDESIGKSSLNEAQRKAARLMNTSRFSILTGGPGTGKTYTLSAAVKIALSLKSDMKIVFAAPTGKAAARMSESLRAASEAGEIVPEAQTLHKLIGISPSSPKPLRNESNPIDANWLIVDEASMIDLSVMAKMLMALPESCRLTLVGDAHQLASVERGRVFGDLCAAPWMKNRIIRLVESRRFEQNGEIHKFSQAVNSGEAERTLELLDGDREKIVYFKLEYSSFSSPARWGNFQELVAQSFRGLSSARDAAEALAHINDFRVLCVDRIGPFGCKAVNDFILKLVASSLSAPKTPVPVMITRNDRALHIANGDIGVIMPQEPGLVCLAPLEDDAPDTLVRKIPLELIEDIELAYASTIHKSQGSEFKNITLVLGVKADSPLLTREILYTGITRTRDKVYLFANNETIAKCCNNAIVRVTGLR